MSLVVKESPETKAHRERLSRWLMARRSRIVSNLSVGFFFSGIATAAYGLFQCSEGRMRGRSVLKTSDSWANQGQDVKVEVSRQFM
jgi:hypothetical protein